MLFYNSKYTNYIVCWKGSECVHCTFSLIMVSPFTINKTISLNDWKMLITKGVIFEKLFHVTRLIIIHVKIKLV